MGSPPFSCSRAMVVSGGLEPPLVTLSTSCLYLIGLRDHDQNYRSAPSRNRTGFSALTRRRANPSTMGACAPGRIRTCTVPGLSRLPLPNWATGAMRRGTRPGIRTRTGRRLIPSPLPVGLDGHKGWRRVDSNHRRPAHETGVLAAELRLHERRDTPALCRPSAFARNYRLRLLVLHLRISGPASSSS